MYDYEHLALPVSFRDIFANTRDPTIGYTTRYSYRMSIPRYKSQFSHCLPPHAFPPIWNKWNMSENSETGRRKFKALVKQNLLANYKLVVECDNPFWGDCSIQLR